MAALIVPLPARGGFEKSRPTPRSRDPEILTLIRRFEQAEREEDRLFEPAAADPDNDDLQDLAYEADRRRLEAADALCQAIRAREVADGNVHQFSVKHGSRIYFKDVRVTPSMPLSNPPDFYLRTIELARIIEV
jgi:hypothetical protein